MTSTVPGLAAITLSPKGGGVAAVARLLWQVLGETSGDRRQLVTLVDDGAASLDTDVSQRIGFGARVAWAQASRQCDWLLYSHLALARAQEFVPSPIRRPYAVFLHGIEAWRPLSRSQERALRGAAVLLANSHYTARRVGAAHPWIKPPSVCPLALEPAPPQANVPPDALNAPWGERAVVLVGRMSASERYKGHDELLECWPGVLAAQPDARLVFVGDGDDLPRLKDKARALGVAHALVTTGFVDDGALSAAYRQAALFAMPSRNEGFGLVYLEAMSHGLPCVGSVHDAASEIIVDGVTGYLVDQREIPTLADRIAALLRDEPRRRAMGEAGRQRALADFSYAQFRDRVSDALRATFGDLPVEAAMVRAD